MDITPIRPLWLVDEPTVEESLVKDLAAAIQLDRDIANPRGGYPVVSVEAQKEAVRFYEQHGFLEALDSLARLRAQQQDLIQAAKDDEDTVS